MILFSTIVDSLRGVLESINLIREVPPPYLTSSRTKKNFFSSHSILSDDSERVYPMQNMILSRMASISFRIWKG